jgi:hypothetical protein
MRTHTSLKNIPFREIAENVPLCCVGRVSACGQKDRVCKKDSFSRFVPL